MTEHTGIVTNKVQTMRKPKCNILDNIVGNNNNKNILVDIYDAKSIRNHVFMLFYLSLAMEFYTVTPMEVMYISTGKSECLSIPEK